MKVLLSLLLIVMSMHGAISCEPGYWLNGSVCSKCPAGTFSEGGSPGEMVLCWDCGVGKTSDEGSTSEKDCRYCTSKPANSSYTGTACKYTCNKGYYGAKNTTSGSCSTCGKGYWCDNGVRNACGKNMTTATTTASAVSECVCKDGYVLVDGACVAAPKQTLCSADVSTLYAGDYAYPLYNECDSPAIWIGLDNGNCCVNLVQGAANGALNIEYNGTTYHATE